MRWVFLFAAIAFEISGTACLKLAKEFTVFWPSVMTVVSYVLSFFLVSKALKSIDLGIAYAIWCAGGIVIVALIGCFCFHEPMSWLKAICLLMITAGCVGLQLMA